MAYVINILMSFYERHFFSKAKPAWICKIRRTVSLLAAIVTLIAVIILVLVLIVPQLISCVQLIFAELPGALTALTGSLDKLDILPENIMKLLSSIDWQSTIGKIFNVLTSGIGDVVNVVVGLATSVFNGIVSAFMSLIFAVYLLLGKEKLGSQFTRLARRYIRKSWRERGKYILDILNDCFHRYIVGQCTEAVILGILCTIGMLIFRLPYAAMIGALIAFTALIPVAGAYIGGIVGAFMILTESPIKAVIFVVFLVVLQQLEGNIIYPRVVGSSMGLPGIWVLAAVTIGGGMLGIGGMLLGVPVAAAVYRILKNDLNKNSAPEEVFGESSPAE